MDMEITFGTGDRVNAQVNGRTIATDQDGSAPQPFELFLASIGACAGIYVSRFCRKRGLATDEVRIVQHVDQDPATHMVRRIDLRIELPEGFPEAYRDAVVRSAQLCAVKKHLEHPPTIDVATSTRTASATAARPT